jgi:hypothetical protein
MLTTINTNKAAFFLVSLLGLLATSFGEESCSLPMPVYGGTVCGPGDNAISYMGPDTVVFHWVELWRGMIPIDGGYNQADFTDSCSGHDLCYSKINGGGSERDCYEQFSRCNIRFFEELTRECETLPKICQQNQCKSLFRDGYTSIVKAAVDYYLWTHPGYNCGD